MRERLAYRLDAQRLPVQTACTWHSRPLMAVVDPYQATWDTTKRYERNVLDPRHLLGANPSLQHPHLSLEHRSSRMVGHRREFICAQVAQQSERIRGIALEKSLLVMGHEP